MNRKTKTINFIITIILPVACLFGVLIFAKNTYSYKVGKVMLFAIIGATFFGLFNVFFHELGHVVFGKIKGFILVNFTFLFFSFTSKKKGYDVSLVGVNDCLGSTELVSKNTDNLKSKVKFMTKGGVFFNLLSFLLCIIPFFLTNIIPLWLFVLWAIGAPVSLYCFLANALPVYLTSARNDGGVLWGLKRDDDESRVMLSVYAIESLLYQGKTPSEIDEKYYFGVPQLPEDSLTYLSLLNARFLYYLDIKNYDKAKAVCSRFISLYNYLPQSIIKILKSYLLFAYCTFDLDENNADELMLELQHYLNTKNDALSLLVKIAYITGVEKRNDVVNLFYNKLIKEADKMKISGLGTFYKRLIDESIKK